jgi:hypothetical protein
MDGGNEQKVAIKFCFKAGLSATETLVLVQKVYGNEAVNRSNVFRWYFRFRDGRELVEDDERGGRPKLTRNVIVHKEFVPEEKSVKVEFYKGVMDRLLNRIQRVHPAAFCSRDFFLLHVNGSPTKVHFLPVFDPKICYNLLSPPVLSRFISTRLFSVPQFENLVKRTPLCGYC